MSTPKVHVEMYKCAPGRRGSRGQRYRWRAKNAGNNKILATASEAYTNEADCIDAIWQLFGGESAITLIRKDLAPVKATALQSGEQS
jgi:hypothetical protein